MTTDVKFFHSTMPGAPAMSGTAGAMVAMLDAVLVTGFGLQTATTASVATGVCTLGTPTTPSALVGSVILVSGATPVALNGQQRVTAITANSVSFATAEADTTPTGTITLKIAPAGWVKAFTDVNKAAYKIDTVAQPASPAMLVLVDDTTTYNAKIIGYESMSDIATGVGPFPSAAQTPLYVFKSDTENTAAKPWFVVADSRFVYVGVHHYTTDNTGYGPSWFGFGEFASKKPSDPYRFLLSGNYPSGNSITPDASYSIASTSNESYIYTARSYTGVGAGINAKIFSWPADYGASGGGAAPLVYPNPSDYGLYLCPADVFEGTRNLRGRLPGMLLIPHDAVGQICPDAATAYLDSAVPSIPGKTIGFMPCAYSSVQWGVVAFDLTGPWEH